VVVGIAIFAVIRLTNNPSKEGRRSRFFGSHTRGAWLILFMISWCLHTVLVSRAQVNTGAFPLRQRRVRLRVVRLAACPAGSLDNLWLETIGIWAQIAG